MEYSWRGIRFLCFMSVYGPGLSAAQPDVQQVKGIVGESLTFPVEIANLTTEIVQWRHGPAGPDILIAKILDGKIETDINERFKSRLQLNMNTGSLQIHHLNTEDSGTYQVETLRDNFNKRFYLSVYNPVPEPHVEKINGSEALANRSCTLLCFVGNASEVNVSWMRDGKPLNTTELDPWQETESDSVVFTCVASNPASNKSITVTPSHYCGKRKGNRDDSPRSHILIPVIVLAVIGVVAGILITPYLRRRKKAVEKEGCKASRNSGDIEYSEIMSTAPPTGNGQNHTERSEDQTRDKQMTIYYELQPLSSQNAPC
ncbi:SLAM family member 8-like isoform X2 [Acipenser ruthenus]|nr:SLAM family member 8-like isoform X2 [Acipenser ruthenus]